MTRRFKLILLYFALVQSLISAQNFYYVSSTSLDLNSQDFILGVFNPITCQDSVITPISKVGTGGYLQLSDIAIDALDQFYVTYEDSNDYKLGILDYQTGVINELITLPYICNSLTIGNDNLLYIYGLDGLLIYNPTNGILINRNATNFIPSGDLTFWDGDLYCLGIFNELWKINIDSPNLSTRVLIFSLPDLTESYSVVSSAGNCGESQGYMTSIIYLDSTIISNVYSIDYKEQTPTLLCSSDKIFLGATTKTESNNSMCIPKCDLDSTQIGVDFQGLLQCGFSMRSINEGNTLIISGTKIDSALIWIEQGIIDSGSEVLQILNPVNFQITGEGTPLVKIFNIDSSSAIDFQTTINSIDWQDIAQNPKGGLRRIACLLYSNGHVSDTSFAYLPQYFDKVEEQYVTLCQGDTAFVGLQTFTIAGVFRNVIETNAICDSIVIITVSMLPNLSSTLLINGCTGDSVLYNQAYIQTGESRIFTLTSINGCDSIVNVIVEPLPNENLNVNLPQFSIPCGALEVQILPEITGDLTNLSYLWSNGDTTLNTFISRPSLIWMEVSNECQTIRKETMVTTLGNSETDSLLYFPQIFMPEGFSPENRVFKIFPSNELEYSSCQIAIFDRWGGLVFQSDNITEDWTGNWRNKDAPSGVYVWWIEMDVNICGEKIKYKRKGDVLLVR
jgi:gliding motility-associated-like protein